LRSGRRPVCRLNNNQGFGPFTIRQIHSVSSQISLFTTQRHCNVDRITAFTQPAIIMEVDNVIAKTVRMQ